MKLKKSEFVALLIVVMLNSELLYAQPDMLWSRTFGGENGDGGYSVVQTADGGYAIAGHTRSFGESDEYGNGWLIKTDENGEELWSRTYGGELGGGFLSIVQIDDGFVMAGYIFLEENDFDSFWVVRTDSEGEVIWSNTYGDAGQCLSIIQTNDGGFATVCVDYDLRNSNVSTTRLIKISGDGDQEWDRNHLEDFDAYNWCNSIVQTEDWGYALGGYLELIDTQNADFWLIKTDESGRKVWSTTFNGRGYDICNSLIEISNGGYALVGSTNAQGEGGFDFWLVLADEDGPLIRSQTFGSERNEICYSVIQLDDDDFVIAGYTNTNYRESDFWLVRTDNNCDVLWSQAYDGEQDKSCFSVIQTEDGGFALTGMAISLDDRVGDLWLVKTESDPNSTPRIIYPSLPREFTLQPINPNPFNSKTNIQFELSANSVVKVSVNDVFGRDVTILSDRTYSAGQHSLVWDASYFPTGQYLLRLEANGNIQTSKVVLLK